ncbi:DnaJ-domain-containing protein [Metschnikowia bicuspidata var. bicuspidata NRRL YB-4993]|uniref:DnaJ-domain-containing protein n=1 Tax=Metschnikowia bicuspidata var. bicuspidata NRRL YB-4993 TaxID=869754 RepID=A0A1A0H6L6_9ASCO|nr:DnaJ-domain-containing protein [Metschnikowia bicuspidata var. bicuspidata NRRL YB-4993]OBA19671.1 DnaJ-domain-containing protein [Metschnikowia bicuspidata var. bicuspidata NRRL YB-4993]
MRATHSAITSRRMYSSAQPNLYQVLELLPNASTKDIKMKFKRLSKKYHPDVNAHLSDQEKEANSKRFVEMVLAYDTLKDKKKRKLYDATLLSSPRGGGSMYSRRKPPSAWENEYYGEAKHYSRARASGSYTSHGYNYTRHRVHNFYRASNGENGSQHFTGEHKNRGDRFDVPHFDYTSHLSKQLKFEQRIISKHLSEAEKEAVLRQLAPDGDLSKVSEELITKHLMRQAKNENAARQTHSHQSGAASNPYMYRGPQNSNMDSEESGVGFKALVIAGGAGSAYLLYHLILAQ